MRHLPFKPSRRPKVKAKVVRRPQPSNWLGGAYTVLLALMTATIAAQLIASSLAAMPPLVTVGDRFALAPSPRPSAVNLPILAAAQIATPQAATGRACLLDLQKMLPPGGVLRFSRSGRMVSCCPGPAARPRATAPAAPAPRPFSSRKMIMWHC